MSDDFFSRDDDNDGRAPPKAAASLAASTAARQRKGPPPPPPRRTGATGTATASATTTTTAPTATTGAAGTRPRPTPSRPNTAASATATTTATTTANPATTTSATTTRPRPTPRTMTAKPKPNTTTSPTAAGGGATTTLPTARSSIRTAPVMSRPVGQYYAADTASYSQPTAHAEDTSQADTWDWGAQAPAPAPQPWVAPNPHSWEAPATDSTAASTTSGDWYATDNSSQTNNNTTNNGMYSYTSSGFYGGSSVPQPKVQQDAFLSGRMDDGPGTTAPTVFQPKTFIPQATSVQSSTSNYMSAEEAPLLEELGINLEHILMKTKAVILPFSRFGGASMEPADLVKDADLAGPIAFCLILGAEMVLTGKLQFGYIYGFGVFGCASMTLIVNLMSPLAEGISIWTVSSVLGYALIPVNVLAAVKLIVINLVNLQTLGRVLGLLTVAWSTVASTRLLELGFGLREQRYLIAYPVALLYSAFVMITIF